MLTELFSILLYYQILNLFFFEVSGINLGFFVVVFVLLLLAPIMISLTSSALLFTMVILNMFHVELEDSLYVKFKELKRCR